MNNTKEMLSNSLEELLEEKPLTKITVGELSANCGVSRMTFYYHFKDLFELLTWTFVRRANESISAMQKDPSWEDGLRSVFVLITNNKNLVTNVFDSVGHDRLFTASRAVLHEYAGADFESACEKLSVSDEDKDFVSTFFANALIGVCFKWIKDGMDESQIDGLVDKCHVALAASAKHVLKAFGS